MREPVKGMSTEPEGDVWTVRETAQWLKVNERTVLNWITSGKLYAHDLGRFYRIPRYSIHKMLAEANEGKVRIHKQSKRSVS